MKQNIPTQPKLWINPFVYIDLCASQSISSNLCSYQFHSWSLSFAQSTFG